VLTDLTCNIGHCHSSPDFDHPWRWKGIHY